MTAEQFKFWFEGFAENAGYTPTYEQWERIKAKVAEIGAPAPLEPLGAINYGLRKYDFEKRYG
ncbi:hypothetical protein [Hansschlegelia beijingensis]|uniref:Uncharacterized protein n=1 Tax=Hansschlegelia beijingensis TaxID=1133344 RepID=A0A7W6D1P7_9HYPH|nr:hypothetical protein [Hansschlegelia beijingensis]MBB3972765.1 hypothetical protein [Hansschlegelia beijingensis]